MPDPCTFFAFGLNGVDRDAVGLPTSLEPFAHVQGNCAKVRLTVRQSQNGAALFSAEVTPTSDGTCVVRFPLPAAIFPCGFHLWVEATCTAGGTCSRGEMLSIACKWPGNGGGGNGGGGNGGGGNGGGGNGGPDDWPWPLPPLLFCPLMGRAFTTALLLGLVTLVTSVAFAIPAGIGAGGVIVAGAFAILALWLQWCSVSYCNYWGAILWALKRTVIVAVILSIFAASVSVLLLGLAIGAVVGIITAKLRAKRCRLPSLTTPLQQLPLW
jgi:hypothetical protein